MLDEEDDADITFKDIVVEELPVHDYEVFEEARVESQLMEICGELVRVYSERIDNKTSNLMKTAIKVFHTDDYSWFRDCRMFYFEPTLVIYISYETI